MHAIKSQKQWFPAPNENLYPFGANTSLPLWPSGLCH